MKWVFKVKTNPDGSTRYKARLVVKGYRQVEGINFKETYAPVSRPASLHALHAFASINGWSCDYMDVVTAFLHPKIDQPNVLMNLPELHSLGDLSEYDLASDTSRNQVVRLQKALYGLKQLLRLWHRKIDSFLLSLGFSQSLAEPNLYLMSNVMVLLYIVDLQLFFNLQEKVQIEEVKRRLKEKY